MKKEITTVVFDLGGVMINLVPERCVEAYRELGFEDADAYLGRFVQSGLFLDLECGRITAAEFYDILRPKCPLAQSNKELQDAFNMFLAGVPIERLRAVRELRKRKRVMALSNTNPVMFPSWIAAAFKQEGLAFHDYFPEAVLSFEEGCCKPNKRIFEILLERYCLDAGATLFIDDSLDNCKAAADCGLQTIHLKEGMDILQIINSIE